MRPRCCASQMLSSSPRLWVDVSWQPIGIARELLKWRKSSASLPDCDVRLSVLSYSTRSMRPSARFNNVEWGRLGYMLPMVGFLAMYVPTYTDLCREFWSTRDGSYGAVMFCVCAWLVWR